MNRKEAKRFLREHPEFEAWLQEDSERVSTVRSNPGAVEELYRHWSARKRQLIDFKSLSQKTKRASEMLSGVQSIMDMFADNIKKL